MLGTVTMAPAGAGLNLDDKGSVIMHFFLHESWNISCKTKEFRSLS